jgi:hypothetical protein
VESVASHHVCCPLPTPLVCLQYNIFGHTFQSVLEGEDSEVNWDTSRKGFDASVVYIHRCGFGGDWWLSFCGLKLHASLHRPCMRRRA